MLRLWDEKDIAAALGVATPARIAATGVSIDTRTLQQGDIFIALKGGNHNGHSYVEQAFAKGAAAAIISEPSPLPHCYGVEDTTDALEKLGAFARDRFAGRLIALTGSVGKTTAKEMLLHCLSQQSSTFATKGNLNNHFGVPLTLSHMPPQAHNAIIEMGMNHGGEIAPLSYLAEPDIALITTIAPVHVGNFANGLKGIANAKAEIFAGLCPDGVAVLPLDAPYYHVLARAAKNHFKVTFGTMNKADCHLVSADYTAENVRVVAQIFDVRYSFTLGVPSRALVYNAIAVLCVCHLVDANVAQAAADLANFSPLDGRGGTQQRTVNGQTITVIDDSYNASPASIIAALETLKRQTVTGRRIAVLGDMLELGEESEAYHLSLKKALLDNGIEVVYTAGAQMGKLFTTLPKSLQGMGTVTARELIAPLCADVRTGDVLLVKGSAGMKMIDIIQGL